MRPTRGGDGLRLALTTLTVLPVKAGRIDRVAAGWAMSLTPLIGAVLGGGCAGLGWLLLRYGLAPLPCAATVIAVLALSSRGLHLDGLADTVDGLASYSDRAAALEIMKKPDIGPLGVAAVVGALTVQTTALAALLAEHRWLAVTVGVATGRTALTLLCSKGIPAARPDGLGALVAGSVPVAVMTGWVAAWLALSWPATPRGWTGLVAVGVPLGASLLLSAHVRRRLGGVTGDVLGAGCELSTCLALLLLSVR